MQADRFSAKGFAADGESLRLGLSVKQVGLVFAAYVVVVVLSSDPQA